MKKEEIKNNGHGCEWCKRNWCKNFEGKEIVMNDNAYYAICEGKIINREWCEEI